MTFNASSTPSLHLYYRALVQAPIVCLLTLAAPYCLAWSDGEPGIANADMIATPAMTRQNLALNWHAFNITKQDLLDFVEPRQVFGSFSRNRIVNPGVNLSVNLNVNGKAEHSSSVELTPLNFGGVAMKLSKRVWFCHIKRISQGVHVGCRT